MTTQKENVLAHLEKYGSITKAIALEKYGAKNISTVINKLKKDGHRITTRTIPNKDDTAKHKYYDFRNHSRFDNILVSNNAETEKFLISSTHLHEKITVTISPILIRKLTANGAKRGLTMRGYIKQILESNV